MKQVAINGFGRIGRNVVRALLEAPRDEFRIVAINDLAPAETSALLLELDSTHGRLGMPVSHGDGFIEVDGQKIAYMSHRDPAACDWGGRGIDLVMECTGIFTDADKARAHIDAGASRVLVSAPSKGADATIVYGVNHASLTEDMTVISNASCTTNCLAPVASALHTACGIKQGFMTTIHAYTGDQNLVDGDHKDPYRARAAALNMVPSTTGAARAVGLVLPELMGRLDGVAIRVPTPNVSAVDLVFEPQTVMTADEINAALVAAAATMAPVMATTDRPLVSTDFNHDPASAVVHLDQTRVMPDGMTRVLAWYDNEWGFSNRMLDTASAILKL
ncbi:MAG: type I glyceraldehyde-3-phosphate dehydrogenase [SAR116 cluster bacterium MED-G06]|nr:MAG: type I glyceraldehyde-3-phosphate dehydrogenase [SAR116 cluster bacterium MED-G06]